MATQAAPWWGYQQPAIQTDWSVMGANDPLASFGQGTWASNAQGPFTYDQRKNAGYSFDYDPAYSSYTSYDPMSGMTQKIIDSGIQRWLEQEHPELFDFETGTVNPGFGGGGNVGQTNLNGRWMGGDDPAVYKEIETAASRWGLPANFLKAIITKESSGNWARDGSRAPFISDGQHNSRILPYIGAFEEAISSRTSYSFDSLVGNRAAQIDALAQILRSQYDEIRQKDPNNSWVNVAAYHYSGDYTGRSNPAGWETNGTTADYMATIKAWMAQDDAWVRANGGTVGTGGTQSGMGTINAPEWQSINQWDATVNKYAAQYGVPSNLVKAIMRVESNGSPTANSPAGATGLMQVMPDMHGYTQQQLLNPETNIQAGIKVLADNFKRYGDWSMAARAYHGFGSDGITTDQEYWSKVNTYWLALDNAVGGGATAGGSAAGGPVTQIGAVWGNATYSDGTPFEVTQEYGPTEFSQGAYGQNAYGYSLDYMDTWGHPGLDIGMPDGTKLYSPVSGRVEIAGGTQYYIYKGRPGVPQQGELKIVTPEGHEIILGHMSNITVKVGQVVNPGDFVGLSGNENGDHVHLEYRVPDPKYNSGFHAVDPRQALAGLFTGSFQSTGNMAGPGISRPYTYSDLMRAGARGETIYGGTNFLGESGTWNSWMQRAMAGLIPHSTDTTGWQVAQSSGNVGNGGFSGYVPLTNPYRWY